MEKEKVNPSDSDCKDDDNMGSKRNLEIIVPRPDNKKRKWMQDEDDASSITMESLDTMSVESAKKPAKVSRRKQQKIHRNDDCKALKEMLIMVMLQDMRDVYDRRMEYMREREEERIYQMLEREEETRYRMRKNEEERRDRWETQSSMNRMIQMLMMVTVMSAISSRSNDVEQSRNNSVTDHKKGNQKSDDNRGIK